MPTKIRERGLGLTMLLCGMAVGAFSPISASAQGQPAMTTPLPAMALMPEPPSGIHPTLNVQMLGTTNSNLSRGSGQPGKKELVLSVTPAVNFQLKGAQNELVGQFQVEALRYVRATQPDALLPSGDIRLKLEPVKDAVGVETNLRASRARTTATAALPQGTENTSTDTTLHIAPYLRGRIDSVTHAEIRLDRGWLESTDNGNTPSNIANDRDSRMRDDRIRVLRQPVPIGYDIQLLEKSERYQEDNITALAQREASAALLLAPDPEVTMGFKLLRSQDRLQNRNTRVEHEFEKTSLGYQLQWRPTSRSLLNMETENRSYGRSWLADIQNRWRWVSIGLRAERSASTYARDASRAPSGANPLLDEFQTGAQLRQALQGRMIVMGRRNQVKVTAGFSKSAPLTVSSSGELILGAARSREHFFETELIHQLTPTENLTGSVRWGRTSLQGLPSRDFVMRGAVSSKLSPDTTATIGLKRQITHFQDATYGNETAGYVNLGHRF